MVLSFVCACGPGVYSAASPGAPFVTLRAEVVTAAPQDTPASGLEATVLWAALPADVEACLGAATDSDQVVACAGANFRPRLTSMTVPVEPAFPAAFELPVHDVPPLEALGTSRFGYGLLAVLHDGNGNGALDLVPPEAIDGPDRVLGTSLRADSDIEGDYLAYREGDVPPAWNAFRLLVGCPDPLRGYFMIRLRREGSAITCRLAAASETFTLELAATARVRSHACQYAPAPEPLAPPSTPPPAGSALQCWGSRSLEVVEQPAATCRRVVRYDLGSSAAPSWWTCDPSLLELTPARAPLTDGVDRLFTLRYVDGAGSFRIGDLRIRVGTVTLKTLDSTMIVGAGTFEHDDRDGDGRFSKGDVLTVNEDEGPRFSGAQPASFPVQVWAESDGRMSTLAAMLSWAP